MIKVDAHAHLWLKQNTIVEGKAIRSLTGGRSEFMGEVRQMLPPSMIDGRNTAEVFLANMDYAGVSAAVLTQEYIDGPQNDYLREVQQRYPRRFVASGLIDARRPGFLSSCEALMAQGFTLLKLPAARLITAEGRISLTGDELMSLFHLMEKRGIILGIELAEGDSQTAEMEEIVTECPALRVVIGHFGMVNRPHWKEQIKLARHKGVMIESGGITWLFHKEFYPYKGAVEAIKEAADSVGMEKLMWGSDYPRTAVAVTYRMTADFVTESTLLTQEEKELFMGKNAMSFFGFKGLKELPSIKNMSE